MKKNKLFNIFKNILIFLCIIYLFYELYRNFNYMETKFTENKNSFFIIILINIIFHNLLSLRNFSLYKICAKYTGKFNDWSQIFFESLIFNVLISHTGSIYRAIETKKRGLEYKKYIGIFYILFTSYILINVLMIIIEMMFLQEVSFQFKLNLFLIFLTLFVLIIYSPKTVNIFIKQNILKKKFQKSNLVNKIIKNYELIYFFIVTQSFLKKTVFYLLVYGIIIHFFELYIFYLSSSIIQSDLAIKLVLILFGLSFILDRIPLISNIPGMNEILFASISIPLGLFFYEGLILKLILRITGVISIFINYLVFYVLNLIGKIKI